MTDPLRIPKEFFQEHGEQLNEMGRTIERLKTEGNNDFLLCMAKAMETFMVECLQAVIIVVPDDAVKH